MNRAQHTFSKIRSKNPTSVKLRMHVSELILLSDLTGSLILKAEMQRVQLNNIFYIPNLQSAFVITYLKYNAFKNTVN